MMNTSAISAVSRAIVSQLLDGKTDDERKAAVVNLSSQDDKDAVADFLVENLKTEEDGWTRAWIASALAAINKPDTVAAVATRIEHRREYFAWARYWATLALAKMQPPDLKKYLIKATRDPDQLVCAVALRLLIENGFDEYIDQLLEMAQVSRSDKRWAVSKALRRAAGYRPLPESAENRFLPILVKCLLDPDEWMDSRFQAAMALGDMEHKWLEAIRALSRALEEGVPNDWTRRACVDSLRRINKPETRDALLFVLQDKDAEIRVRAADALKEALGSVNAANFIVDHLLRSDQPSPDYLDALRRIDQKAASKAISEQVMHPDPKVQERARVILMQLGGEEAIRLLQKQRTDAMNTYSKLLENADNKIVSQLNGLMGQAQNAFSMTLWMHGIIFGLGVMILAVSLYVSMAEGFETFERFVGVGAAVGSLATLLTLFYSNPLKNIRDSVNNLVKVNIVFIGFMRQINQIDASFKQLFLSVRGFGPDEMKDTVQQIQDSVKEAMAEVKQHLG